MHKVHKYLSRPFLIGLSVASLAGGVATAQTSNIAGNSTNTAALEERIAQRKETLKLQLSTTQSQKIAKNCVAAQSLVKSITAKDKIAATKRQQIYTDLSTKVTSIIRALQSQEADIAELKSDQIQFDSAINKFVSDNMLYSSTADDLIAMDCPSDPAGFEALLTTARQQKTVLSSDAAQIKTAKATLSQALVKMADSLNANQSGAAQ
jgi:hypothetical protein